MITLQKFRQLYYVWNGDTLLGDLSKTDDGRYVFWPTVAGGYWRKCDLVVICNHLDELNTDLGHNTPKC